LNAAGSINRPEEEFLMGMRSGTTFKKRQKELARLEKARDKVAKRAERKAQKGSAADTMTDEEMIKAAMHGPVYYDDLDLDRDHEA
jgi:hypothetical protein